MESDSVPGRAGGSEMGRRVVFAATGEGCGHVTARLIKRAPDLKKPPSLKCW